MCVVTSRLICSARYRVDVFFWKVVFGLKTNRDSNLFSFRICRIKVMFLLVCCPDCFSLRKSLLLPVFVASVIVVLGRNLFQLLADVNNLE